MAGIRLAEVGSASNDRSERTFESCLTIVASKQRDTFHDWLIAQSACRLGIERGRPRDGSVGSSAMRASHVASPGQKARLLPFAAGKQCGFSPTSTQVNLEFPSFIDERKIR